MSDFKECEILEKDIILLIKRKPITITEISKKTKRAKSTISEAVKRLANQEIVTKTHNYKNDARNTKIVLNLERIKIEKTHTFYLIYFILSFIPFLISLIISLIFKKYFLVIGCSAGIFPSLVYILYQAYIKEDKTVVYKNPKIENKKKNKEQ